MPQHHQRDETELGTNMRRAHHQLDQNAAKQIVQQILYHITTDIYVGTVDAPFDGLYQHYFLSVADYFWAWDGRRWSPPCVF